MPKRSLIFTISVVLYFRFFSLNIIWLATIYAFNALLAGHLQKIKWSRAFVYISTLAILGPLGEIVVDTVYRAVVGTPLWSYNYWPVHYGYTSFYAPILWGTFGAYLYLLHDNLRAKWSKWHDWQLALIFSFEALILEALADIMSRAALGSYLYYYYPSNLWHISALQNIPFYFLFGYLVVKTIKLFLQKPAFSTLLNCCLLAVAIWIA